MEEERELAVDDDDDDDDDDDIVTFPATNDDNGDDNDEEGDIELFFIFFSFSLTIVSPSFIFFLNNAVGDGFRSPP